MVILLANCRFACKAHTVYLIVFHNVLVLLICNGVARFMELSLKEIMTIKNIRLNILWTISPTMVILVR